MTYERGSVHKLFRENAQVPTKIKQKNVRKYVHNTKKDECFIVGNATQIA